MTNFTRLCSPFLLLALPALANPPHPPAVPPKAAALEFIANRRQWEPAVLFAADVPAGRLFLERGRLVQALYDGKQADELHHNRTGKVPARPDIQAHAYSTTFVGADLQAAVSGEAQLPGYSNYFLGSDKSRWASEVPGYEGVRYQGLYPGIDLHFYSKAQALEYDFEVAAGADARHIALRYAGQSQLRIVDGALHIGTSIGTVVEQQPYAYQVVKGQRRPVPCAYALGENNTVTFTLPRGYDHRLPLVIDPVLVYASYSGATATNYGFTATYDSLGNLYSGGNVFAVGYPVTMGAYSLSYKGSTDIGVMKLNPSAATGPASRVWATYIGGQYKEQPHSMVVDHQNNLIILGSTESNDYPTTVGAYDASLGGGIDLVVTKLNATGSTLVGSTFLGGSGTDGQLFKSTPLDVNYGDEYRGDVTVDRSNNIYLASVTLSTDFPTTPSAFQPTNRGVFEGIVCQFSPTLTALPWSTYLGGNGGDAAYSIQLDSIGNIYVGGGTTSTNLAGTQNAYHSTNQGGADGFITKISAASRSLVQTTYLGTTSYDQVYFVQLDKQGNVYALGQTTGNYPVSAGVYANAGSHQFIHKLNAQLTASVFSTVVGNGNSNSPSMSPMAFLVSDCGQIIFSGWTLQSGMPVTADALQKMGGLSTTPTVATDYDGWFYAAQLSANARSLVYGTYYGNTATFPTNSTSGTCHVDGGTSRFDKKGIIYQAVCSGPGTPLITTANAWSPTNRSGFYSSAGFKLDVARPNANFTTSTTPRGAPARTGCAPVRFYFDRSVTTGSAAWNFGSGLPTSTASNTSVLYTTPGTYVVRLTVTDSTSCNAVASSVDTVKVYSSPRVAAGPDQTICAGQSATLAATNTGAAATYTWSPATGLSSTTGATVRATPTVSTQYIVRAITPAGCTGADTVQVLVVPAPRLAATASTTATFTSTAIAFASTVQSAATYSWDFGDNQTSTLANPVHTYSQPGSYQVRLTATSGNRCTETAMIPVTIRTFELPNIVTPNADGLNDTFRPSVSFAKVNLQIFNRWGRKVYEKQDYTNEWGPAAEAGLYYFQLVSTAGESWNGWVEVVK